MQAAHNDQASGLPQQQGNALVLKILGVAVIPVTFNWLSALWSPTAPVVIVLAVVTLGLLALSDSSRFENSPLLQKISAIKRDGHVELFLAALVVGFVIASVSLIPLFPTVHLPIFLPGDVKDDLGIARTYSAYSYEVGAVATIVLMVTVAAYRATSLGKQLTFLASAIFGTTIAVSYLRPDENSFMPTLVGNFLAAGLATILLAAMPRMYIVLKSFWAIDTAGFRKPRVAVPSIHSPGVGPTEVPPGNGTAVKDEGYRRS